MPAAPRLTLYGKPGCHLCDEAREVLRQVGQRRAFELDEVDITLDPILERRLRERIPVVAVDGEEAFDFFVDAERLIELLDRPADAAGGHQTGR